jgi:hypothetical protein
VTLLAVLPTLPLKLTMTAYLEPQILPASHFNCIPSFEQQGTVDPESLAGIAAIFVENQMHDQYGAATLHRHLDLPEGHILVHSTPSKDVDLCKPESLERLDPSQLIPNSLFLNTKAKFQAFEYDIGIQRTPFSDQFFSELRSFLTVKNLTNSIAIVPAPASDGGLQDSVEYLLPNKQGMISVPRGLFKDRDVDLGRSVITGWTFHQHEDGIIECRANKRCVTQSSGLHKVVKS